MRDPRPGALVERIGWRARTVIATLRDPRARALRTRRRARRAAIWRSGAALVAGSVTAVIGSTPGIEVSEAIGGSVTGLVALGAVAGAVRAARLHRQPLPSATPAPIALPHRASAARDPLVRLAAAETGLHRCLDVLRSPRDGVASLSPDGLDDIAESAARASMVLRTTADSLMAVEAAVAHAPAADRAALGRSVGALRTRLDHGVDEVCGLVAAAGRAVVAAQQGRPPAELLDATDRMSGLAAALDDLAARAAPPPAQPGVGPTWQVGHQ